MQSNNSEGCANNPIVVLIGIVAGLIAIFIFVTGIPSLPDMFRTNNTANGARNTSTSQSVSSNLFSSSSIESSVRVLPSSASSTLPQTQSSASLSSTQSPILFEENFEDGKTQLLNVWDSNWKITNDETGNRVFEVNYSKGSGPSAFSFGPNTWTNYAVEYRIRFLESKPTKVYLEFRRNYSGTENYLFDILPKDNTVYLGIVTKGQWRPLTSRMFNFTTNQWYAVHAEARDSQIVISIDNIQMLQVTDSNISTGQVALKVDPGTRAQVDDIRVHAIGK